MVSRADNVYRAKGTESGSWENYLNGNGIPAAASVVMTKYCNFRCPHCNVDADSDCQETMSKGMARKVVYEVSSVGIPLLILSGGEITKRPELLLYTLEQSKEAGYKGVTIVQTNGSFAAGKSNEDVMDFLETLRQAGAGGIEITSDDSYHKGGKRNYIRRAKALAGKVFGEESVSTYGIRGPIVPIGRAEREVPRSEWSVGEKATFWNDYYNMHNLVKIYLDGTVYSCPWMSVRIGDLNKTPLKQIIGDARQGIAGKISRRGGFARLDPESNLGIDSKKFKILLERLGECGACHEYFSR